MNNIFSVFILEYLNIKNKIQNTEKKIKYEELLDKYNLSKRDKYIIDGKIKLNICSIITKENCILLQIDSIRGLITEKNLMLFRLTQFNFNDDLILKIENSLRDKYNDVKKSTTKKKIKKKTDKNDILDIYIPDELTVLEEIFIFISEKYEDITDNFIKDISDINEEFEIEEYKSDLKNKVPLLNSRIIDFKYKVCDIKDKFNEILNWDDDDLEEFCIGEEKNEEKLKSTLNIIETLFLNYKTHFEDYDDKLSKMLNQLDLLIKKIDLQFADQRNKIATFNTKLDIYTLALTSVNLICSIFGMNLKNHLENNNFAFFVNISLIIIITILLTIYLIFDFRKIRK